MQTERRCDECGQTVVRGQPDPCLGYLPGVVFACCGHGRRDPNQAYIAFENGVVIRTRGTQGSFDIDDVTCFHDEQGYRLDEQGNPRQAYWRSGTGAAVDAMLGWPPP